MRMRLSDNVDFNSGLDPGWCLQNLRAPVALLQFVVVSLHLDTDVNHHHKHTCKALIVSPGGLIMLPSSSLG